MPELEPHRFGYESKAEQKERIALNTIYGDCK